LVVIQIKADERVAGGWPSPLIIEFDPKRLAIGDFVCIGPVDFDQAGPGPVVVARAAAIVGGACAKVHIWLYPSRMARVPDQAVVELKRFHRR